MHGNPHDDEATTDATASASADDNATNSDLPPPHVADRWALGPSRADYHAEDEPASTPDRTWEHELPRWLATLDSDRTRREYEKAVGYFFHTPGVPAALAALTFDLLLAYRGSLALRAERQPHAPPGQPATPSPAPRIARADPLALPTGAAPGSQTGQGEWAPPAGTAAPDSTPPTPLAPATVNIRLTALRQFLTHCSLWGHLPDLPPERMRAALRRLRIERRRPYQILAEPEWAAFLRAAEAPGHLPQNQRGSGQPVGITATSSPGQGKAPLAEGVTRDAMTDLAVVAATTLGSNTEHPASDALRGSRWGTPRATRQRQPNDPSPAPAPRADRPVRAPHADSPLPALARPRSGLTGAYTAQRDHALLALALATGLRAIELCALDLGDLAREWNAGIEEWWLILPDAKTKGQHGGRTLPLAPALVTTLLAYVSATRRSWSRAVDRITPLFLSHHFARQDEVARPAAAAPGPPPARGRLSPQQIRRIVDRVETQWLAAAPSPDADASMSGGAADTRAISPHALRHSTAIALLEGNEPSGRAPASVEHVRGWLGHFDIRTTQGYLAHLDARRHRRPFMLQPVADTSAYPERDMPTGTPLPQGVADKGH